MTLTNAVEERKRLRRARRVRVTAALLSLLLCLALGEVAARAYWRWSHRVPFGRPDRALYAVYPGLRNIDDEPPAHNDASYDVLLLGASGLHRSWGNVEQELLEQLAFHGHRDVRIFNLAEPAHTSRDSRLKYAAMGRARFELVVVYDGINDVRVNNVPPDRFRSDYEHYSWYAVANMLARAHGTAVFALPYTIRRLAIGVTQLVWSSTPTHWPEPEWVHFGRDVRSAGPFEDNLRAILDLAEQRGDRVLLMTMAIYVPDNYSDEAFDAMQLDYGTYITPLALWGEKEHVANAVDRHNDVVRRLAAARGALLLDQAKLLAGQARYFNDPCHLTAAGSARFAEHMVDLLLRRMPAPTSRVH